MTSPRHCTARWKALFQIQMAAQDALRDEEIHNAEDGQQGKHHADKQVEEAGRAHAGRELNKETAERLKVAQHDDGRDRDRLEHHIDGVVEQHSEQDALAAEQVPMEQDR